LGYSHALCVFTFTASVANCPDFFRTVLILTFLYGMKLTPIRDGEKSGNSTTCGIFNICHYNFMEIQHLKVIVVVSLLLCKIQLVPLLCGPSFLRIDTSQTISMIMDLYRR
jgi:hypothetical protein